MLQRAASNAYSWWWASHIRTKQSKWMEQNLQDMEEKVQHAIKLVEEDGDSFAKRAEMYYKKRPELISFIEETYKAYRALAERYDHISTELQNANNAIASVFPDRVPFMDEEEESASPRTPKKMQTEVSKANVPKPPLRDLKSVVTAATAATKKLNPKKTTALSVASKVPKSGLSRKDALEEVDKLQKQILSLQTVKEFVKSSYDNAIARYWETGEKIKELQDKVSVLQDEIGEGIVIEDDEARRLMAEAALKSCQETLEQLEVKQEKSVDETKVESERINDVKAKLASLMNEFQYDQSESKELRVKRDGRSVAERKDLEKEEGELTQQIHDLQSLQETVKVHFEASSHSSLAATEMAEKIDELVNKVISLETSVSSQTALVNRLKTETDELQGQVRTLEDDKESLIKDENKLNEQLRDMEQKMLAVQDLNHTVEDQNSDLKSHFTEAHSNIDSLSVEVQSLQPSEEVKVGDSAQMQKNSSDQNESKHEPEAKVPLNEEDNVLQNEVKKSEKEHTDLLKDAVNTDEELKIANDVKEKVASDNKIKVTDSPQDTLETEGAASVENRPPKELKEQEKALNPGDNNQKETVAMSTITNTENCSSESFEKLQENDAEKGSTTTENTLGVDQKEHGKDTVAMSTSTTAENHSSESFDKLQENDAEKGSTTTENTLGVDQKEHGKDTVATSTSTTAENHSSESFDKLQENDAEKGSTTTENTLGVDQKEHGKDTVATSTSTTAENHSSESFDKLQENDAEKGSTTTENTLGVDQKEHGKDTVAMSTSTTAENHSSESFDKMQENNAETGSTKTKTLGDDHKEHTTAADDEPDWRQMFLNGMQDREKTLLTEYTNTLRSYKVVKKKLAEIENKNQDNHLDYCLKSQLHELKTSNSLKDQEIRILHRKLSLLQITMEGNEDMTDSTSILPQEEHDIEKLLKIDLPESTCAIEEKFRSNIDEVLEENLTFWLKFSTTYAEIQRFETTINDLQTEVSKLEKKIKPSEGSGSLKHSLKSDARPIYKHLTEIQTDITVWMEKSALLKTELQCRFSSLCVIQEEITNALKASAEDEDFRFTSYEAAKFQGEVLNMKQENNRVADELQAGLDMVTSLQLEVEKALVKLNEQFGLSASKREESGQLSQSESRARVPLRSFIFGVKPKKQSIFSCMSPGMNRKFKSAKN
ncbi:protein NETWORKED 2D isoform X2 [Lathyrus oleraceus]|uniref:protein NETWORKED 2D isoform X2 n=1 Tax=Pisum sativum TaxID=3888 RepID=UPI0021D2A202|nr:protein NETWORKED 2D-like isoform X2 [Pisum sativum]